MESILVCKLVDEICQYLEIRDIVNFHLAYNFNLCSKLLFKINDELEKNKYKFQLIIKTINEHDCSENIDDIYNNLVLNSTIDLIIKK